MSDDAHWEEILRNIEKGLGHPLTPEERRFCEQLRPEIGLITAEAFKQCEARRQAAQNDPLMAFMRRLMTRQGTIMPDFDALYKRKAELDDHRP